MDYNPYLDSTIDLLVKNNRLPHWHQDSKIQFVTFRLADSLPKGFHAKIQEELKLNLPNDISSYNACKINAAYHKRINDLLDNGYGRCLLRQSHIRNIVLDSLNYSDGLKYDLLGYVIMPNHVHLLLHLLPGIYLDEVMHSIKGYSSHKICKTIEIEDNKFWMADYYDRMVRDKNHLYNCVRYIRKNFSCGGVLVGGSFIG